MDATIVLMPRYSNAADFLADGRKNVTDDSVSSRVTQIITQVREQGDSALFHLTRELDGVAREQLGVTSDEWACSKDISTDITHLLTQASDNVRRFHTQEKKGLADWRRRQYQRRRIAW